jgi:hypothetical protein
VGEYITRTTPFEQIVNFIVPGDMVSATPSASA